MGAGTVGNINGTPDGWPVKLCAAVCSQVKPGGGRDVEIALISWCYGRFAQYCCDVALCWMMLLGCWSLSSGAYRAYRYLLSVLSPPRSSRYISSSMPAIPLTLLCVRKPLSRSLLSRLQCVPRTTESIEHRSSGCTRPLVVRSEPFM